MKIKRDCLSKIYDMNDNAKEGRSVNEADELFYNKIDALIHEVFNDRKKTYIIESCFRFCGLDERSYSYLKPIDEVAERVEEKVKGFNNNTIGIHVRRTDHVLSREMSTKDKVMSFIDKILKSNVSAEFFVSSDSEEEKIMLAERYGQKIIVNNIESCDRTEVKANQFALLDLYCLSKTSKIYGSYFSTFSQVAADINKIEIEDIK